MNITRNHILKNSYNDSVVLMQLTVELENQPGVEKAAIMMGTPAILDTLEKSGLLVEDRQKISANDIVIAVNGTSENDTNLAIDLILERMKTGNVSSLSSASSITDELKVAEIYSWQESKKNQKLALISVPGEYAAPEAMLALRAGKHVFLFSNNVSIEDEFQLKKEAVKKGLLMMGPDCGTAVINGVPLGFANVVSKGTIGIVAASGSGLQELICLIDRYGAGISNAIGTGGRDLKKKIGGMMTTLGLELLRDDPSTKTIVVLSKPADKEITERIIHELRKIKKNVVVCLLGSSHIKSDSENLFFETTIEGAARTAVALNNESLPAREQIVDQIEISSISSSSNRYIKGFFSGGTLAYETLFLLEKYVGDVYSNISTIPENKISIEDLKNKKHIIFDLGTEDFTTGRPHPMIDGRWRADLISESINDPNTGIILFDVILGLGADKNPLNLLIPIIKKAQSKSDLPDGQIRFIASLVGTDKDPQDYSKQKQILQENGVIIAESNADAVRKTIEILMNTKLYR